MTNTRILHLVNICYLIFTFHSGKYEADKIDDIPDIDCYSEDRIGDDGRSSENEQGFKRPYVDVERIKTFCKYIKLSTPEEIIQLEAVAKSLLAPKW